MKIITEYHGSWIDNCGHKHHEWIAYDDDSYDGPGSPMGSGSTEAEALDWLAEMLETRGMLTQERDCAIAAMLAALDEEAARDLDDARYDAWRDAGMS